jgi:hypothetical protein
MSKYSFIIKQGKTFERRFVYQTGNPPLPFDFTGYEVRGQIRPTYTSDVILCNLSSSIQPDGTGFNMTPTSASVVLPRSSGSIGMVISAFSSSQFNFDTAFIDIEIYSGSGVNQYVKELISGTVKVLKQVTR